ncbi:MAG TPA: hypothetical protein VN258_16050 [Mobilitalea sp.]|nr:hypothetical protein [Mobilitalea sp.]
MTLGKSIASFVNDFGIFIIPLILFIYCIAVCKIGLDKPKVNIKRFYYTFFILLYIIFIKTVDISKWCGEGPWKIRSDIWSNIVVLIAAVITAIIIENLIITGFAFKELGLFGTKFIKDESQNYLIDQRNYVYQLEYSLESLYEVSFKIRDMFLKKANITDLKSNKSSFCKAFKEILEFYYELKSENVVIHIRFYKQDENDINEIVEKLMSKNILKRREKVELKNDLINNGKTSNYFSNETSNILVMTENVMHCDERLLITIQSKDDIMMHDIYPIISFLNTFELEISKV